MLYITNNTTLLVAGVVAFLILCYFGIDRWYSGSVEHLLDGRDANERPKLVDPWLWQMRLMEISNQRLPDEPMLTKDAILYSALVMEELGETVDNLANVMQRFRIENIGADHSIKWSAAYQLQQRYKSMSDLLAGWAAAIRDEIKHFGPGEFDMILSIDEAVALADDVTDNSVVGSGLCLALGLPGPSCYLEVARSNHSKANPETGVIDKDPTGKWIKGADYIAPDLQAVLVDHGFDLKQHALDFCGND